MAYIRKRGKSWQVEIRKKVDGSIIKMSATRDTKAEALAWAISKEASIMAGGGREDDVVPSGGKVTLYEVLEQYMADVAPHKKGARWEIVRCKALQRKLPFVGMTITSVKPSNIAEWRNIRLNDGVMTSTINRELNLLSSVFEYAKTHLRMVRKNPCHELEKLPDPPHRSRLVPVGERKLLLEKLGYVPGSIPTNKNHYVALAFLFAILTAARAGEILKIRWQYVDFDKKVARVTGGTKNGDYWRDLPLLDAAIDILHLCKAGNPGGEFCFPVTSASLDALFRKAKKKAGIEGLHFHDTRHQAATDLSQILTHMQLARVMGHKTPRQTMSYYNEDAQDIALKLNAPRR